MFTQTNLPHSSLIPSFNFSALNDIKKLQQGKLKFVPLILCCSSSKSSQTLWLQKERVILLERWKLEAGRRKSVSQLFSVDRALFPPETDPASGSSLAHFCLGVMLLFCYFICLCFIKTQVPAF